MGFSKLVPMLNVSDLVRSRDFYCEHLGFELISSEEQMQAWRWAMLQAGGAQLMLMSSDPWEELPRRGLDCEDLAGVTCVYYLYSDDVEGLHAELTREGVEVAGPETTFYGMKEIHVLDPDGHRWTIGQSADDGA